MLGRLQVLRVLHPFPSVLVALLTVGMVWLADREASPRLYVVLGVGMLLYQCAIGVVNDVVDAEEDRVAKPWKPLARGAISTRAAAAVAVSCAGAGMAVTSVLPPVVWGIGVAGLAVGLAYDVWLKRTPWSWLPYAVALPLVPLWAYAAAGAWHALLWWVAPLGAMLGFALHLANQAGDASQEGRGLPDRLGEGRSRRVAVGLFAAVAVVVSAVVATRSTGWALASVAVGAVGVAGAPGATGMFGRDGLFGLLAVTGGLLALLLLSVLA